MASQGKGELEKAAELAELRSEVAFNSALVSEPLGPWGRCGARAQPVAAGMACRQVPCGS